MCLRHKTTLKNTPQTILNKGVGSKPPTLSDFSETPRPLGGGVLVTVGYLVYARLERLVRPHYADDKLHVVGIPKSLDMHVLPTFPARLTRSPVAAKRAQEPARKAFRGVHRRDRCGWRCAVELCAVKVPLLEDVLFEFPHGGLIVHQTQCSGGGKGNTAMHRTMKARTVWLHLPNWHIRGSIWLAPSMARDHHDRRERVPSPVFWHLIPIPTIGKEGDQVWGLCPTFGFLYMASS